MLLNLCRNHNIIEMENVAIKSVQKGEVEMTYNVKTGNEKNTIWITMIGHGGSGHEVQESWPLVALRTESREERIFSSGINCMSV